MISSFDGEHAFLSNFFPCEVARDGILYPTVEHAFQAAKTNDTFDKMQIAIAETPGRAKRLGRKVTLRPDWEEIKLAVMEDCLREKFCGGSELRAKLVATGDEELVEGNWWNDTFWGVCNGKGENHLGKLLMKLRAEYQGKGG